MLTFTAREAKNKLGEVFRAAESTTVEITNHGKPIVHILSVKNSTSMQQNRNSQEILDQIKFKISCEILSQFSLDVIRKKAKENLKRWKAKGTWSQAYDEWLSILDSKDDTTLISSMIGSNERSNQLRQSMPYVGLLDQTTVRKIHEEIGS